MLELIICGVTLGVCFGIGCGATFFACIYLADWFENRSKRPLKTEAREIIPMLGEEEPT